MSLVSQAAFKKHWRIALPVGALILAALVILMAPLFSPTVSGVSLEPYIPKETDVPLEMDEDGNTDRIILYTFKVDYRIWHYPMLSIRTNGCLTGIVVDGQAGNVDTAAPPKERCARGRVITLNLADSLHYGTQKVTLLVRHTQKQILIDGGEELIRSTLAMRLQIVMLAVMLASVMWSAIVYRMEPVFAVMLLIALALYVSHILSTRHVLYSYDLFGHLEYIRYVSEHYWRPPPLKDNITRHPPLYYFIASPVYLTAKEFSPFMPWQWVRMYSVACFMVFLVYGLRSIGLLVKQKDWLYYLACALFVFWPNNLITATRINNDLLMYAFYAMGVFYILRWREDMAPRDMMLALVALAGGLFTKLSAVGLMLIIAFVVVEKLWQRQVTYRYALQRGLVTGGALVALSLVFGIGYNAWAERGKDTSLASVPLGMELPNTLDSMITTDTGGFDKSPFLTNYGGERFYIINYFIKTSIFGDFVWKGRWGAETMLTAWIVMLSLMVIFACCHMRRELRENAPVLWLLLGSLIPYVGFRLLYATHPTQDFRYIYPMLIGLVVFWVYSVRFYEAKGILALKYAQAAAGALIVVMSLPFVLNQ